MHITEASRRRRYPNRVSVRTTWLSAAPKAPPATPASEASN